MGGFTQDILIPGYSGNKTRVQPVSDTELSSSMAGRSRAVLLPIEFVTLLNIYYRSRLYATESRDSMSYPYDPLHILLYREFRLFPVRSPLLRESLRFLFLWLLRCFTSPGVHRACAQYAGFACMGCPIRRSPDQRLLNGSPRLIAVTPRPSSLLCVKASSIRPFVPLHFGDAAPFSRTACTVIDAMITPT